MADTEADIKPVEDGEDETPGYKAPAKVDLKTLTEKDADDEALVRYKQQLLAGAAEAAGADTGGANVEVQALSLVVQGRPDVLLDLTGDLTQLKEKSFTIKEGCEYRLKISFKVKREIVSGLRYVQRVYRKGVPVDKANMMVGSYGPKPDIQCYQTPIDDAPKGMLARGHYTVKSKFTDDDATNHLNWEWAFDIKKEWE